MSRLLGDDPVGPEGEDFPPHPVTHTVASATKTSATTTSLSGRRRLNAVWRRLVEYQSFVKTADYVRVRLKPDTTYSAGE
jgi:hypothetical protein